MRLVQPNARPDDTDRVKIAPGNHRAQGQLGCWSLAVIALLISLTTFAVDPGTHDLLWSEAIAAVALATAGALSHVRWERHGSRPLLVFPLTTIAVQLALGLLTDSLAPSFLAILTLAVVYVGLTQPPRTTLALLPLLASTWWVAYDTHGPRTLVRLPLSLAVWGLVGELISRSTRRHEAEAHVLRSDARTDPLTLLGNRRTLDQALDALPVGGKVLFLDLDHFKNFNDRFGHDAGDRLLADFAGVLRDTVRESDIVARFGGEEFVVLLDELCPGPVLYRRLSAAWAPVSRGVTFSAGLATRERDEPPAITLGRADGALYDAKAAGRDRLTVATDCFGDLQLALADPAGAGV